MAPRTLTQYAPIVDVTEPGLFALLATAFAFTFNSRNEAEPEHQDVIFRATYDDRTDPADLVWSSENELGTVIPLRQPRQAMVVGGSEAQAVKYGSITLDRPEALALPAGTPAGNAIQTVAQLTASQYMLINNGSAGARLERFVVAADGTLSAQSLVATLTGGADDVFSVAGASTAGDALILHDADGGSLSMQRYRASSDDLIALSEAQLVDLDTMNAPVGIAHHGSTTFIAVDNTPQSVPALYLLTITQNAVAQLTSLGTVTAMSGLSAQGLMIDTPGQAVIAASDGRMWRVFYDVDTGLGDAVAMSKPNGLISPVSGLAVLPPPAAAGIRWMDVADFGASQRVAVSVTNADDDSDTATISRLRAGSDAITVIPTNEAIVLPTSAEGVVSSYTGAEGEIRVYRGSVRLTEGVTFTRVAVDSNLTATVNGTTGAYSITNLAAAADQANLVIRVEVDGEFTIDKIITVTKAQQGPRGSGIYSRMVDPAVWSTAEANAATPGENRLGDRVTLFNEAMSFAETRFWTGLAWEELVEVIDGSLVVTGTIAGAALIADAITARELAASSVNAATAIFGELSVDHLSADVINSRTIFDGDSGDIDEWTLITPLVIRPEDWSHLLLIGGGGDLLGIRISDLFDADMETYSIVNSDGNTASFTILVDLFGGTIASHTLDRNYEVYIPYGQNALGFEFTNNRVDVYEIDLSDFSEALLGRTADNGSLETALRTIGANRERFVIGSDLYAFQGLDAFRIALSDVTAIAASHTLDRNYEVYIPYGQNALGFELIDSRVDVYEIDLSDFSEALLGRTADNGSLETALRTIGANRERFVIGSDLYAFQGLDAFRIALSDVTAIAASHTLDRNYEVYIPYGQNALGFEFTNNRVDVYEIDLSDFSEALLGRTADNGSLETALRSIGENRERFVIGSDLYAFQGLDAFELDLPEEGNEATRLTFDREGSTTFSLIGMILQRAPSDD